MPFFRSLTYLLLSSVVLLAADTPDFTTEVRPILSRYCFKCHGPDEAARKGKLRLDLRESALKEAKSGAIAVVPGKPDESELVTRVFSHDEDEVMPPPSTKQALTDAQKDVLKRWIAAGAEYKQHWSFVAPVAAAGTIDGFITARLQRDGLALSPRADNATLARRLYLDLIGLPPTPEQLDAFLQSAIRDPQSAIDGLVDSLLASPQYGERWARRWLDLARYADSNGYEKDRTRNVWPYRDWVVRALNADMPFDQFTIEQVAGDLLPNATLDQRIATGFHRNTMLNEEGGIDPLEFRYHAMVDRVATTGAAWLGLTLGCAQCHTHKYDPITHRDYFSIFAFLNNADEPELDLPPPDAEAQTKKRAEQAAQQLAELAGKWPVEEGNIRWETPKPISVKSTEPDPSKILDDGSVLFTAPGPEKNVVTLSYETEVTGIEQVRLEALTDDSLPSKGPGRVEHGNFVLTEIAITVAPKAKPDATESVKIASATADVQQEKFPITRAFDGQETTGWAVHSPGKPLNATKTATFKLSQPVGFLGGTRVTVTLQQNHGTRHTIGRPRLSFGAAQGEARPVAERRREAVEKKFNEWLARERGRSTQWTPLRPAHAETNLPLLTVLDDASVLGSGDISKSDTYDLTFTNAPRAITALRLEALPHDSLPAHGPGLTYYEGPRGDFFLGEFTVLADGQPVKFARTSESFAGNAMGKNPVSAKLATDGDPQTGWSTAGRMGEAHEAVFVPERPLNATKLEVKMIFGRHYACSLGHFRISATTDARGAEAREMNDDIERLLLVPDAQLTAKQRAALRDQFLLTAPELAEHAKKIRDLRKPPTWPTTLVLRERPAGHPRPTFVHHRGEFTQPKERVEPAVLSVLNPLPAQAPHNRLAFARWLVSPENPLTARVAVNRAWAAFFGRGLVKTTEDFGFQGESPTHPELLDWLAVEFVKQGWSMKKLHRLIVTSATYQQAERVTPEHLAKDPENKLLARFPRKRLEAEVVRDSLLRASGLLSLKMGGAPVKPPQAEGISEVAYSSPKWDASAGEDRYRRSLYTFVKRTAPFAFYNTFDAPTGEQCIPRRDVSNTSLQALSLLNDVVVMEAAQALGKILVATGGDDDAKLRAAYRRVLSRDPRADELPTLRTFLATQRQRFTNGELDPKAFAQTDAEHAAWIALSRAIFNLDEAVTKS